MTRSLLYTSARNPMSKSLWLSGVALVLILWAITVALVGYASGRVWEVASDRFLLTPLLLSIIAWTAVWLSSSLRRTA